MTTSRRQRRARRDVGARDNAAMEALFEHLDPDAVPPGIMQALKGARDVDEVLDLLMSAGVLPTPDEVLAGMLDGFEPLLRRGCDEVSAELAGYEFVATLRSGGVEEADLTDIVVSMITAAEGTGTPEALAMARVLAMAGPAPVQVAAAAAADRLRAAGVVDPSWAPSLGCPTFAECFGYSGPLGDQDIIAIAFDYGRKRHIMSVLIDHFLGGGVKDCWVGDGPRKLRAAYADSARRAGVQLCDYTPAEAVTILDQALAKPPCPVELDQVMDVAIHLNLLRQRVELLRAAPPSARAPRGETSTVHRLKIKLRGSKPPIWRRIEIPSDTTLDGLHAIIGACFGWAGGHLWMFSCPDDEFGPLDAELGQADTADTTLAAVAGDRGDRLRYTYDFGDDWEHDIVVEDVRATDADHTYPRCVTGRRAGPPEDCGGIWGYADLVAILADPEHLEHSERLAWLGLASADDFDPAHFNVEEINRALSSLSRMRN